MCQGSIYKKSQAADCIANKKGLSKKFQKLEEKKTVVTYIGRDWDVVNSLR